MELKVGSLIILASSSTLNESITWSWKICRRDVLQSCQPVYGIHYMELKGFLRESCSGRWVRIHYMELKEYSLKPTMPWKDALESITWSWKAYLLASTSPTTTSIGIHYMELKDRGATYVEALCQARNPLHGVESTYNTPTIPSQTESITWSWKSKKTFELLNDSILNPLHGVERPPLAHALYDTIQWWIHYMELKGN
jgi:hypothetical protein